LRTIAAKFPKYGFEDLLDKTPAWLSWAFLQAVELDLDFMRKMGAVTGHSVVPPPTMTAPPDSRVEQNKVLGSLGFKVKR